MVLLGELFYYIKKKPNNAQISHNTKISNNVLQGFLSAGSPVVYRCILDISS